MRARAFLLVAGLAALMAAAPARANTTFTVSTTADGAGSCDGTTCTTLRAALTEAARVSGPDTILLPTPKPATDFYDVNAQLPITSAVTIQGTGAQNVAIKGDGKSSRVFSVGANQTVTITRVTIAGGAATAETDTRGGDILVGQGASLTLDHVRVTDGRALRGGGIAALGATKLTIRQSLIDNNVATFSAAAGGGDGGGLISIGDVKLARNEIAISDSTIARNTASNAPGISLRDNPNNVTTIDRSTIAFNSAGSNGGSGIYLSDGEKVTIGSSILAANTGDGTQDNCTPGANIVSTGGNIEDRGSKCGFTAPADRPDTASGVAAALTMDGGQTPVLPLVKDSPAIDFAPACAAADQRDLGRPQGKSCDSGAYEVDQAPEIASLTGPSGLTTDANPQFTFSSTEPGVSYECKLDGPGGATGTFVACTSPRKYAGLADGGYTFSVHALDGTHPSPPVASLSFTVDTTPPAAPAFTSPPAIQNSSTVTISGTAELFSKVTVVEGTTTLGTVTTNQAGVWSLPALTGVADGAHTYRATAQDVAGNTGPESTRTVTVDTKAPNAPQLNSPADNSTQNTSAVTVGGTAEGGSTVTVLDNGSALPGTVTAAANGTWSKAVTAADGAHAYTAKATDAAGNTSPESAARHVTVDTHAPAAPVVSTPTENAFVTTATPALSGTSEGSATITVKEGTTVRGTGTAAAGGAWSVTLTTLTQGSHTLSVTATDAASNESGATTRTIRVDTIAPVTTLDRTGLPTRINGAISFTFSANETGSTFQCRLDTPAGAGNFGGCTSPKGYTGLTAGNYRFHVMATDPAGNPDPSDETFDFTVDTTAPAAPVVSQPADNALVNTATPQLSGTAEAGAAITVKEGTTVRGTGTATGGNWSATLSTLSEGSHTLSVTATDQATNESSPTTWRIRVDTVKPAAPAFSTPANNAFLNSRTVAFTGTAEAGASVQLFEGANPVGNPATATGGNWTVTLSNVTEAAHTYTAKATDAASNVSDASGGRTVTVDISAPDTAIQSGPNDPTNATTATFTFSSSEPNSTFECRLDGPGSATGSFGACPANYGPLADGRYTFQVRATDQAKNTDGSPATYPFTVDTQKPDAPTVSSPADNALINHAAVELAGTAEAGARVEVFEGASSRGVATRNGTGWALTVDATDGTHTYRIAATDAAGNVADTTWHVRVDTGPPAPPAITRPADGALLNSATFTVEGEAESGATVELFEGNVSKGSAQADGDGWSIVLAGVADGPHTYVARATDVAGNHSGDSAERTVTVDTTPPPADVTGGPSGTTTDSAPAFSFGSDPGTTFECKLDGPAGPGAYAPCTPPKAYAGLPPGNYTFFVRAIDAAGNASAPASRSFTVTAPLQATQTPPTPTFQQSVVVQPVGGKVLVRRKGSKTFVALDATQGIPLGSEVDTKQGKVRLSSVPRNGGPVQTALFYSGIFVVTQSGGITNLKLSEPLAACPKRASAAAKKKKAKSRRLWGDGSGAFRTQGQYSAATVRGTKWLVQDSCAGTLTRVARGVVAVNDRVRHKTILLKKGKRYLAKPRRR